MAKIDIKVAEEAVNEWLKFMRVKPRIIESKKDDVTTLIDAVCHGEANINDAGHIVQVLDFPVGDLKELVYDKRIKLEDVGRASKGAGGNDASSLTAAYISAATGVPSGVIKKIDNSDLQLSSLIMGFF